MAVGDALMEASYPDGLLPEPDIYGSVGFAGTSYLRHYSAPPHVLPDSAAAYLERYQLRYPRTAAAQRAVLGMPEGFADLQGLRDEGALLTAAHVQYLQDSAANYVLISLQQEATYQGGHGLYLLSRVLHDLDGVMASATRPVEATP